MFCMTLTSLAFHVYSKSRTSGPRVTRSSFASRILTQSLVQVPRETTNLRPRGGRKLALQNGKVEGSEVGKNTALFLEAGVKSPLYVVLCPDPPAREEREERRKDERQRGERERERERERRER